ncbi:MAG: hypothetical protein FWC32_00810 [Firmicutes bacterium]|nr:hypothetical protein [Bacillota bacterium]
MMQITISKLQKYIAQKDFNPDLKHEYFYKLSEEVGELSRAMRKNVTFTNGGEFKGTVEEEVYDVLYYVLAIANSYDIDVNRWIYEKEKLNDDKYNSKMAETLLHLDTSLGDLESLSTSSIAFWENDIDDEVWNDV